MADINHGQLILMHATVCCFSALYVDFPALIGCSGKDECLCYESQCCLKLNTPSLGLSLAVCNGSDFVRLKLILYEFALKMPTVLCKAKNQCFCCASQVRKNLENLTAYLLIKTMDATCLIAFRVNSVIV